MASAGIEEDVKCSICLNIYTDPVTLKCGHNFCQECIQTSLDIKERNCFNYSCPQCRKRFRRRPTLKKNTDLSKIAEKVKSSAGQENTKCSEHSIMEYYCTEDSTCICVLCWLDGEHQGHEVEILEKVFEKKKDTLRNSLQILRAEREKTENRVQNLHQRREMATKRTDEVKEKVAALFKDVRKRVDDLENQVRSQLSRHKPISDLIQELELEKEELSKKIDHMEKLYTADPITLLQDQESDIHTEGGTCLPDNEMYEPDELVISMMLQKGLSDIEKMRDSLFPVLPSTTITLDNKTEADYVEISEDLKTAKSTNVMKKQPNFADMFKNGWVLSTQEFSSGKHYWMVEGSTSGDWVVGMCYPSMWKEWGWIGKTNKSWAIEWSDDLCVVKHNQQSKYLHHKISNRLLVYLDYEAGRLSFYELCDPPNLLHTFATKFTEPLRAIIQVKKYNSHSQIRMI